MSLWANLKISTKIIFSITFISLAFTALFVSISISTFHTESTNSLREKGTSLAIITGETVKASVQYNIAEDTEKVLSQLAASDKDVSVTAVIIQGPKGDYSTKAQKMAKGYEAIDLAQPMKDLAQHPPANKGETVVIRNNNLLYVAAKIEHVLQGFTLGPFSQLIALLNMRAVEVFPMPLGPVNKYA